MVINNLIALDLALELHKYSTERYNRGAEMRLSYCFYSLDM